MIDRLSRVYCQLSIVLAAFIAGMSTWSMARGAGARAPNSDIRLVSVEVMRADNVPKQDKYWETDWIKSPLWNRVPAPTFPVRPALANTTISEIRGRLIHSLGEAAVGTRRWLCLPLSSAPDAAKIGELD